MLAVKTRAPILPMYITENKSFRRRATVVIGEAFRPDAKEKDYGAIADDILHRIYALKESSMSVTVAKTAGFCFGVRRAVDLAERAGRKQTAYFTRYGEIIHNMHEIRAAGGARGCAPRIRWRKFRTGQRCSSARMACRDRSIRRLQAKTASGFAMQPAPFVQKITALSTEESPATDAMIIILGSAGHPEGRWHSRLVR